MSDASEPFEAKPADEKPAKKVKAETAPMVAMAQSQEDRILEKIFDAGNIEVIERYMALKEKTEARLAKKMFNESFALMQKDFKPVEKTHAVKDRAGKTLYFYAPIEDLVKANGEAISSHGFSWRFTSEAVKDGEVRAHCIISGYGHEEDSYFDGSIDPPNSFSSASKQRAGAATFAQRYAFKGGFGMTVYGEDDETPEDVRANEDTLRPMLEEMSAQGTQKTLMDVYIKHFKSLANDKAGQSELLAQKNAMMKLVSP